MSSEKLERCCDELKALLDNIQDSITYQLPKKLGDDHRRSLSVLNGKIDEAQALYGEIQSELGRAPVGYQHQLAGRVSQYKESIASLRRQVNGGSSLREQLFSRQDEDPYQSDGEKSRLLGNTETLKRASASVGRAQAISAQTDEVAVTIMEDLDDQKASLLRTRNNLTTIDGELGRTSGLLRSIVCKSVQNRLLLVIVIICEIIILAGVIYWKFIS
ncbi:vesicle transport through interaction with t-SNAREs homolog 1B-like [Halichondria panicea]|uniref:vesicle transport through interaction with t-SNAREs homolog 1B-like n=1 Tax=Halichondria panicea TaxID=6063 RepID=UPI00312B6E2E